MDKLAMATKDITNENIEKILELFPNVATEGVNEDGKLVRAIDFEKLKQELSHNIIDGEESYDFTWVGKKEAMLEANRPIRKTLRPDKESSLHWDTTENIYIEGDNLDALKLLQESYLGKVKMIYIDPPYNTGNDFIYRDNFTIDKENYDGAIGVEDEEGYKLFKNNESNGRFHSDWCSMIYPRLKLARNLLSDDGVIFISIDENEVSNLKSICDEIFGEENRLSTHHIQVRYDNKTLNEKNDWQPVMEYIFIYAKSNQLFKPQKEYEDYSIDKFKYEFKELTAGREFIVKGRKVTVFKKDEWDIIEHKTPSVNLLKETWVSGSIYSGTGNGQMVQNVIEPRINIDGYGALYKIEGLGEDGLGYRYFTGPQTEGATRCKMFSGIPLSKVEEIESGCAKKYKSIPNLCTLENFAPDFGNIVNEGGVKYNSGKKPIKLIKNLINISNLKEDDIVLDFFAGSATTAHAIIQLNAEDGGNRKFIMVQLPEILKEDVKEQKDTYTFLKGINKPPILSELGKERIRRAGKKIQEETPDKKLDIGFRVFKVDDTNMKDVYYSPHEFKQDQLGLFESNIKDDRSDEDLLYEVLINSGVELSLPHKVEIIDGMKVHFIQSKYSSTPDLIACFEDKVSETLVRTIAQYKPTKVVFRDSCFRGDSNKINIEEIFKLITPDTRVKVL